VTETGVYRAIHSVHRLTHEVTVRERTIFPKCRKCGFDVRFELVRVAEGYPITAEQALTGMLVPFDDEDEHFDTAASS
jgi:hypothetical protein